MTGVASAADRLPEYTILAVLSVVAVVALEKLWARTGLLSSAQFWCAQAIVMGFQVLVDGWLTRLDAPIVRYADWTHALPRWPWDIPMEDFLFGFAMTTATLLLWVRATGSRASADGATTRVPTTDGATTDGPTTGATTTTGSPR